MSIERKDRVSRTLPHWWFVAVFCAIIGCGDSVAPAPDTTNLGSDVATSDAPNGPAEDAVDTSALPCEGACQEGTYCDKGKCIPNFCPPTGPFGVETAETFTDVVVKDCDGNDVHIHELCGAPAGFFNLLAGW